MVLVLTIKLELELKRVKNRVIIKFKLTLYGI